MSVLTVESDTAQVSDLPVVGSEVPAVYAGKVALDSVGLRVGPSCLQLDPEETLPALLDERGVMSGVDPGVIPDGGPIEGTPVLEPLEHSVLEKSPDGVFMQGAPVLEPFRAFGSINDSGLWTYGGDGGSGSVRVFGSGNSPGLWTYNELVRF